MNPNSGKAAFAFSRGNRSRFQLTSTTISDDLANKQAFVLPSDVKDGDQGSHERDRQDLKLRDITVLPGSSSFEVQPDEPPA